MSGTCILFCTAQESVVRRALEMARDLGCKTVLFGPEHSPFNKPGDSRFISWGAGHFQPSFAFQFLNQLRALRPSLALLPLNNTDGSGYGWLRLFARLITPNACELPRGGLLRKITFGSWAGLMEHPWHNLFLRFLDILKPAIKLALKPHIPSPHIRPRPRMEVETLQDFYDEEPPAASIVIRTLNEERFLGITLEAIARQEGPAREVIVIDSGSTDRTVDIACSHSVRVYRIAKESFHYSATLNLGARLARGPYLINVSAHSVPQSTDWMLNLIAPMQEDTVVAGVCGRETPIEGWASPFERKLLSDMFGPNKREMTESFFFSNANAAVRRDRVLETPFDEDVHWGEDQVWAHAMHQRGFKTVYTPLSAVAHSHNLSMIECLVRTLKFQRTLFHRMHRDRAEITHREFRAQLGSRALAFRRFMTGNRIMGTVHALVVAPWCEYLNYLGCEIAWREWRRERRNREAMQKSFATENEAVS